MKILQSENPKPNQEGDLIGSSESIIPTEDLIKHAIEVAEDGNKERLEWVCCHDVENMNRLQ